MSKILITPMMMFVSKNIYAFSKLSEEELQAMVKLMMTTSPEKQYVPRVNLNWGMEMDYFEELDFHDWERRRPDLKGDSDEDEEKEPIQAVRKLGESGKSILIEI